MSKRNTQFSKRSKPEMGLVILDVVMLVLLVINLHLIVFDWLFQSDFIRELLLSYLPQVHNWYLVNIHQDFLKIDLIFVAIFLTEFFFHWVEDIYHKRHPRWYYYPFVYWYDLLGCIPVGSLRFLRLLRVITIITRLHKMGWINITRNPLFDVFARYTNIAIEEITDRVVVRILGNVRDEIKHGTPVIDQIVGDVITPRKQELVNWLSIRVRQIAEHNKMRYHDDIRSYVDRRINEAVEQNQEIGNLNRIPLLGKQVGLMIERATADIVFNVINGAIEDLGSEENREFVEDITNIVLDDVIEGESYGTSVNQMVTDLIVQSLDIIIAKVNIKEWQYEDLTQNEELLKEKLKENLAKSPG